MKTAHRVRVVLGFSLTKIAVLIAGAQYIYSKISGDTTRFPSPTPRMPAFLALIRALQGNQPVVASGVKGAAAARENDRAPLVTALEQLVTYVQGLVDVALPENKVAIVVAAGMKVSGVGVHVKQALTLANVKPTGTIRAVAYLALLAGTMTKHATFNWQYSIDGEKTWINAPSTPTSQTTISGITPLTVVAVRVAVTVGKEPMGSWSQVATLVVQ